MEGKDFSVLGWLVFLEAEFAQNAFLNKQFLTVSLEESKRRERSSFLAHIG